MTDNAFEKAAEETKQDVETTKVEISQEDSVPSNTNGEVEIDLSTIVSNKWQNTPKEIGTEWEEELTLKKFIKAPGKEIKIEGKRPFWSGLVKKNPDGTEERLEEQVTILTNSKGEEVRYKLSSWEEYYKFMTFVKFCNTQGLQPIGFKMKVKRLNKGSDTAGLNYEFYFTRGDSKFVVTGKSNEIKKL